jgi:hypothetical protein
VKIFATNKNGENSFRYHRKKKWIIGFNLKKWSNGENGKINPK